MNLATIVLCALLVGGSCKHPAPARDDARARDAAVSRSNDVDCATAMASLKKVALATPQADIVEPLVRYLNKQMDLLGSAAAVNIEDVKRDAIANFEESWPELYASVTRECITNSWPADARACYARINTEQDVDVCDRLLKGWQVRRMNAAVVRTTQANQRGVDRLVEATLLPTECKMYKLYGWRATTCMKLPQRERDQIAGELAKTSAAWDLDGDTDVLVAPCEAAADRLAARLEAVGCKLDDAIP